MRPNELFASKDVTIMESDGNYTHLTFSDGSKGYVAYTQKEIERRFSPNLKRVNRRVSVKPDLAKVKGEKVRVGRRVFKFSRRMKMLWLILFASPFSLMAQNVAPVAVNDTLRVCNDQPSEFLVTGNDTDANGDRLRLTSYNRPSSGDLVALSNTGYFVFDWSYATEDTLSFSYHVKDLRFGNVGSLESNLAYVTMYSAAPYYYTGTYSSGTNNRVTCISENSAAATITTTAREVNEAYQYILLDATNGTVEISPASGGVVEFSIK